MISRIRHLFGMGIKTDYKQLVKEGALILDVRSQNEFAGGHIVGAVNIPVDQLLKKVKPVKDINTPIIICCASGVRSASAKSLLLSMGYTKVFNGGGFAIVGSHSHRYHEPLLVSKRRQERSCTNNIAHLMQ